MAIMISYILIRLRMLNVMES